MGTSKKNAKATKKFEQKHLKGVLERRKTVAKIKQQAQIKAKKQAKRAGDAAFYKGEDADEAAPKTNGNKKGSQVSSMSVDDFFQGGFEIIDKKASGANLARLGKRKRTTAAKPAADAASGSEGESDDDDQLGAALGESDGDDDEADDEDAGMSKGAMAALAEKDPEFYKYLKENDPEALDFDEDVDLAEIDALSGSEGEDAEEEEQPKKKRKKNKKQDADEDDSTSNELTKAAVAKWKQSLVETHSLRAARQVVLAFRSAAHLNEDETAQRFAINDPEVFHEILLVALEQIPAVLQHHIPVKESASHRIYVQTDSKKYKTLSVLVKSFTASVLHLLNTLSDDATLKITLSALTPLLPYLLSYRKLLKHLVKTVVQFWSQSSSTETTRITAFLVLRRLVVIGDKGVRESVLRAMYQGLIQGSRQTNANTIQGINLMKNSAAEIWGIDQSIGYTTAFTFIRQLAIHLRNSIVNNKQEAYRAVYNWQYIHSLDFWSCVLAEHCSPLREAEAGKESQLKLLVYPLVQVTLGAMRLIPTAAYFPLRFHLVNAMLRVSRAVGTYIPLASVLLEVLSSAEMKKPAKASTQKPLDFKLAYKAPKAYLRTRVYQDGVGDQVVELFSEYFALWSTNIAFPEFALSVIIMLKRWIKDARGKFAGNKNSKLVSSLVLLVQKLEANAKFIEEKRSKVDFAPKDRAQVDAFLKDFEWEKTPLGAFVVGQRKQRAERAKVMEQARKEEERKRKEEEQAALEEEAEVSPEEDEDEEDDEDADALELEDDDSEDAEEDDE